MASSTYRFAQDSPDSKQAWIWVASLLALIYSVFIVLIRIAIKWRIWGLDDKVFMTAFTLSTITHIVTYTNLSLGLGKSNTLLKPDIVVRIAKLFMTTRILTLITTNLSRLSVLLFVRRIYGRESVQKQWRVLDIALIGSLLWTCAGPLIIAAGCRPSESLTASLNAVCKHQDHRLLAVWIGELLVEFLVILLPIVFFASGRMRLSQRVTIYIAFGLRVTFSPLAAWYSASYHAFLVHGRDNIDLWSTLIMQETLACYCLFLATTPCINTFMRRFASSIPDHISGGVGGTALGRGLGTQGLGTIFTKETAAHTLHQVAVQIRAVGAFSVFDKRRGQDMRAGRSWRKWRMRASHDASDGGRMGDNAFPEGQHWTAVFNGPPGATRRKTDIKDADIDWRIPAVVLKDWEKDRAIQIVTAPRRTSAKSINFITTVQW